MCNFLPQIIHQDSRHLQTCFFHVAPFINNACQPRCNYDAIRWRETRFWAFFFLMNKNLDCVA
jgi:hypothetical protein